MSKIENINVDQLGIYENYKDIVPSREYRSEMATKHLADKLNEIIDYLNNK